MKRGSEMEIKLKHLTKSFPGNPKKNIPDTVAVKDLNIGAFRVRKIDDFVYDFWSEAADRRRNLVWR